jgi:glycosyltransferase involved in cell wall biosynthesis
MKKITFIIPTRNNLEFLQIAYKNIKKLSNGIHNIVILDDNSSDGTWEWLKSLQDSNLKLYFNNTSERMGTVKLFDKGVELADTEIIMNFHADMVPSPNLDINILKHLKPLTVISSTRVEPPTYSAGPEKIVIDFGDEAETFKEGDWNKWSLENEIINKDKTTEGIFAPWCMYKEDYLSIGGYDPLFAPQSKEDSDLFNRFVLNGYSVVQSWDALVYHFTSRGSRFNKFAGGAAGVNSPEWINTNNKNLKNFIRKWGSFVKHDSMMKPIITPKFDLGFRVRNVDVQKLAVLEPLCSNIGIENRFEIQNEYIKVEQPHTPYNLTDKIKDYEINGFNPLTNNIIIEFDVNRMNEQSFNMLLQIPDIIKQSGSVGEFELDIFKVNIKSMETYEHTYIKVNK